MGQDSFESLWERIEMHAGEQFRTKTGLPFTYQVRGGSVIPDRTS
jgi:hypothetical protein